MDNLNKIVSFVLGLIVVIVFIAVLTGRLNLGKKLTSLTSGGLLKSASLTPTPTPTPKPKVIGLVVPTGSYISTSSTSNKYQVDGVQSIPSTGVSTVLFPIVTSGFMSGIFLRKTGKKK